MNKILKITTLLFVLVFSANLASSKENFFDEALKMYQDKNMKMRVLCLNEI